MGCGVCGANHAYETCNLLGRFDHINDNPTLPYARLSLPSGLAVKDLINGNKTVIATKTFLRGVQFGPFKAAVTSILVPTITFPLKVFLKSGENVFLKTDEEHYSNWMCLVAMATCIEEINMYCYQVEENIYFSVISDLLPGAELKVWYAPAYAKMVNAEPLPCENYFDEKDLQPEDTKVIGDHEYLNKTNGKIRKRKRRKSIDRNIADCELPDSIKGKLPADVLGAKDSEREWKCQSCNVVELNLAAYARHLIHHMKLSLTRNKCKYCKIKRNGKHERFCKVLLVKKGIIDGSELTEEERNKTNLQPNTEILNNDNVLMDVSNNLNTEKPDNPVPIKELEVKGVTSTSGSIKQSDILFVNCDKNNDFVNYQFGIMDNKSNSNIQDADFFSKTIWNNDSSVCIDNVNNLVPLSDSNLSLKEKQLDINPPILDLSDEIEFQSLKNFSDTIDAKCFTDKPFVCRNVGCPDLFDNVVVSNLLNSVDNISTTSEQFPIFSLDKSEFLGQKFDNLLDVTDEDKNRLVENLLEETVVKINVYDDEMKDTELVVQDNSNIQQDEKNKGNVEASTSFPCEICKKVFMKPKYLIRHLRKHTGDFSCKYCMNIFARKETLLSHTCLSGANVANRKERCGICSMILYSRLDLSMHIAKHYCTNSKWECQHCKLKSEDAENLDKHFCAHGNGLERQFSCDNCFKVFTTSNQFIEHKQEINVKCKKVVSSCNTLCEICGLLLKKKVLPLHMRVHRGTIFECKECGKKFNRKNCLLIHEAKHNTPKISCSVCNKSFKHKKLKKFACERCTKKTEIKSARLCVTYICRYCNSKLRYRQSLKRHLIRQHGELKAEWDIVGALDTMKLTAESDKEVTKEINNVNTEIAILQNTEITDKEDLLKMHTRHNVTVTDAVNFVTLSKEQLMDVVNTPNISETNPEDLIIISKEKHPELVDIPIADSQELVTLNKDCLLDLVNNTSSVTDLSATENLIGLSKQRLLDSSPLSVTLRSQNLVELSKEDYLNIVGNGTVPIQTVSSDQLVNLNMENIIVNVLLTDVDNEPSMEHSEVLGVKSEVFGPMVQLSAPEELVDLNLDNSCLNNGIDTYILNDGRIVNEDIELGGDGDIFLYVVEPSSDEQELLFT